MSIGPLKGFTAKFNFSLVNYDFPRWNSYENANWAQLDAILSAYVGGSSKGPWQNNTAYAVGDKAVDPDNSTLYSCAVAHTSLVSGTFSQERAANPTYWSNIAAAVPRNRGTWAPGILYNQNDYIQTVNKVAIATQTYTSSSSFNTDVAAGNLYVLVDLSGYNTSSSLVKANNLSDVASVVTSRANLGLGPVAIAPDYPTAASLLPAFTGDSGSGGVKGSVPAPSAGDAAAGKVLGATGSWIVPVGSAPPYSVNSTVTLTPLQASGPVCMKSGNYGSVTLPSGVAPGYTTGPFTNEVTINLFSVSTPTGTFVNSTVGSTVQISFGQCLRFYYDTDGWRIIYDIRDPILYSGKVNALASFDIPIPYGYTAFDLILEQVTGSTLGANLTAVISQNGGSTIRNGSTDYFYEMRQSLDSGTTSTTSRASAASLMLIPGMHNASTSPYNGVSSCRYTVGALALDCKGSANYSTTATNGGIADIVTKQNPSTYLQYPNLLRITASTGTVTVGGVSMRGLPF